MPKTKNYKKNFLKNVIFRIDFNQVSLEDLENNLETTFPKTFTKLPKVKTEQQMAIKAEFDSITGKMKQENISTNFFVFSSNDGKRKVQITPENVVIMFDDRSYTNFDLFKEIICDFLDVFLAIKGIQVLNRIGLRFVNLIDGTSVDYNWSKWINEDLLSNLDFSESIGPVTKGISTSEIIDEDMRIKFVSGIWNEDYPNKALRPNFILDFDTFMATASEANEYKSKLDAFHEKIKIVFLSSVKTQFTKFLNTN